MAATTPTQSQTTRIYGFSFVGGAPTGVDVTPTTNVKELFHLFDEALQTKYRTRCHTGIFSPHEGLQRGVTSQAPDRLVTLHLSEREEANEEDSKKFLSLPVSTFAPMGHVTWVIYYGLEPRNDEQKKA